MLLIADRVMTLDPAGTIAAAVEVRDGAVVSVSNAPRDGEETVAFPGGTILPGFVEHHSHFRAWAIARTHTTLHACADLNAVLDVVRRETADRTPGTWFVASGWAEDIVAPDVDLQQQLDGAAHGCPVALVSRDGHALLTTQMSLAAIDLDFESLVVDGGVVERTATGQPTGVLREESSFVVRRRIPNELTDDVLRAGTRAAAAQGVTTVHDMDGLDALRDWKRLDAADGQLDVRAVVHLLAQDLDHVNEARALASGSSDLIRVGGLKLFADGTLGSGTALLHEPEIARSGREPRTGVAIVGRSELETYARHAASLRLPLLVHAIGDRAAADVIDALEATHDDWRHLSTAPRIEHAQLMRAVDIERCASLGITLSVQPTMLVSDRDQADARWGSTRTPNAFAYRSMLDAGCDLLFGSDAPIEPLHPLAAIHAAVHRDGGAHGLPPARGAWHGEQRIAVTEALRASVAGPLHRGTPADLIVLDGDPDDSTARLRVRATMLGGRWTS